MANMNDAEWDDYDRQRQRDFVLERMVNPGSRPGDEYFLVPMVWFDWWKRYVRYDIIYANFERRHPGRIDMSPLLAPDGVTLKKGLKEDGEYELVPPTVWNELVMWYGLCEGQPIFPRRVVESWIYDGVPQVEVYPLEFQLKRLGDHKDGWSATYSFSRIDTLLKVKQVMRKLLGVPDGVECRMWHSRQPTSLKALRKKDESKELRQLGLNSGTILIQYWQSDGIK